MTAAEFLGYEPGVDGEARFALGADVHGAFGGVFGGAVSAACVMAARGLAGGRRPFSAHVTFVRGLSTPGCRVRAEVVNAGRTATTVAVELHDDNGRLASRATVSLAAGEALHGLSDGGAMERPPLGRYEEGRPVTTSAAFDPPIVKVLEPRLVGTPNGGYAHAVRIPWEDDGAAAEAICMAADFCVGVPVGTVAMQDGPVAIPNPDLSLRFVAALAGDVLVGVGRLGRIDRGVAATEIEVWGDSGLLGLGLSSAVLLAPRTAT